MKGLVTQRWPWLWGTHLGIQEVLIRCSWVLGRHSGGAHKMSMSPGSTWLPLGLSATWSSWGGNTVKREVIVQGRYIHSADTEGQCDLGHLSITLPEILLVFTMLRASKGLICAFSELHESLSQDSWVMEEPFSCAEGKKNVFANTECWHKERQGAKGEIIQPSRNPIYFQRSW